MDRFNLTAKQFSDLSSAFSEYSEKIGKVCEKQDELALILNNCGIEDEDDNKFVNGITNFSKALTILGDLNEIECLRIKSVIGDKITGYESITKTTKSELKSCLLVKEKETVKKRQLEQIRQRSFGSKTKKQPQLDTELKKAKLSVAKATKESEDIVAIFEREKLKFLRNILLDFIEIKLKHCTKSIEILSTAYQDLADISDEDEIDSPRNSHKPISNSNERKSSGYLSRFRSQSMVALNSILHNNSNNINQTTKIRGGGSVLSRSTNSLNSNTDSPEFAARRRIDVETTSNDSDSEDDEESEKQGNVKRIHGNQKK